MSGDLSGIQLHRVTGSDDMFELKRWLGERRPVLGIDTETGGFDWWRQPLRMCQFGDAMTGWAVPFDDWKGLCREIIQGYNDRPIVFHNFKFDVLFLEHNGIQVPRTHLHDSEVMVHLDDASMPKGLKPASSRLIDPLVLAGQSKLEETMRTQGWTWGTIPIDHGPYWQYAALDPVLTARLWELLQHTLSQPIYDIEIRATDVLLRMERRGYRIDLEYTRRMIKQLLAYGQELRTWAHEAYGLKNLTSGPQVARQLMVDGWVPTVHTTTGQPSMTKEVLQWVDHPLARAKVECSHIEKMARAYLENFLSFADGDRLHAKVNPLGARTGRMSITEPALQTLPRDDVVVRNAFIASEGNKLLLCDYDQIELRLMTHFSGATALAELFATSDDVFTGMARQIFHDLSIVKSDPRRQGTKTGAYSKIYGAGTEKFSKTMGISLEEGGAFLNAFDTTFPEITEFQRQVEEVARQRQEDEGRMYVTSPWGRNHPLGYREGAYKLVSYLIQGTAADVIKAKLVELDAAGVADYIVLPVHDELDFDVPVDMVADVSRTIQAVMPENRFTVPITVGIDVVDRWGTKYAKKAA